METVVNGSQLEPMKRLGKDLKAAALTLTRTQARYLVDYYYITQELRKSTGNQIRALDESGEPHDVIAWFGDNSAILEHNIKRALEAYAGNNPVGRWSMSLYGVGPVIASGLLAHIDIEKCPTAGKIWRFAGLDNTVEWLGREKAEALVQRQVPKGHKPTLEDLAVLATQVNRKADLLTEAFLKTEGARSDLVALLAKRPWNAALKTLCWKIGECFTKFSNHPQCYYGHLYQSRKALEIQRNLEGKFKEQAAASLQQKRYDTSTEAYKAYSEGRLPDGRIHLRAQRYAVKLFLSHWHWVAYETRFGTLPPKPYVIEHLGHAELLKPPNWPVTTTKIPDDGAE